MTEKGHPVMAEHINRLNKILVLNIIRQEKEISRADIVKKSGLSAPTVTRIVDSLINIEKLAIEVGTGESKGGRPPMIVRFNSEENYVIGIDWGRTHIHGIISNLNAEIIFNLDIPISSGGSFESDVKILNGLVDTLITSSGIEKNKLKGIGLAVAGFVNHKTQEVEYSPNFGWSKLDIQSVLQEKFKVPIVVDNVSRVMAMGELWYGVGNKFRNFVLVNIGYGLGSGIIVDGKPFNGFDGYAGEIGHNKIIIQSGKNDQQRKCVCGKFNCLECFASGRGIAQTVKEQIHKYPQSIINDYSEGNIDCITTEMIAMAAKAGDKFARNVLEEAAALLAVTLANASNTLNPEAIIIGGKVVLSGEFFIEKLQKVFNNEIIQNVKRPVKLIRSELIGEAGVKGAVALILKEIVDLNIKQ